MTHKEYLQELIAEGNIKQAIKELLEATKSNGQKDLYNSIILQSGKYNRNEKDKDLIDFRDYKLEINRISAALQHYIEDEYEEDRNYIWDNKNIPTSVVEKIQESIPTIEENKHSSKTIYIPPFTKEENAETNPIPPNETYYEHGYALLIGIKYAHWNGVGLLNGTLNDIHDLYAHFTDLEKAAYPKENVITLREEEATAANIFKALEILANKANQDKDASVIVYYSGHGETDGKNHFLVPYDFDLQQWFDNQTFDSGKVVLSKEFTKAIDKIQAKKCLIVLDCCHAADIPVDKSLHAKPDFMGKFLSDIPTEEITEKSLSTQISKGKGRVVLTSCQGEEKSLDLGTNGLFTKVLLESLNGANNIEKDGWVRLIDLIRYVPKNVSIRAAAKGKKQNPVFKRIEDLGAEDFVISAYSIATTRGLINGEYIPQFKSDSQQSTDLIENNIKSFLNKIIEYYPEGLKHDNIWERAGGNIANFDIRQSGKNQWRDAFNWIKKGGGLSYKDLLDVLQEDYPKANIFL